ncbi:hypothetical protein SDC9_55588 [bioreactor metagenome]|uniref:Uncharacterized protein n=1 Tax=bioreactor metagenome TaxID=1076179 RepID=A0A644WZJ1_9ZZZZ
MGTGRIVAIRRLVVPFQRGGVTVRIRCLCTDIDEEFAIFRRAGRLGGQDNGWRGIGHGEGLFRPRRIRPGNVFGTNFYGVSTRRIIAVGRSIRILQGHRIPIGVCGTGGDVHKKLAGLGGTGGYGFYHRDIRRGVGDRDAFRMGGDTRFAVGDRGGQGKCAGVMDSDFAAVIAEGALIL